MLCSPFVISAYYLPNQIHLIVGKEHEFNFDIPLKAQIQLKEPLHIMAKEEAITCEKSIKLNEPLRFKMDQIGQTDVTLSLLGVVPIKTVAVDAMPYKEVIPCGNLVGIKVEAEGICVLGMSSFEGKENTVNPAKELLKEGDIILKANNKKIESKEEFKEIVEKTKNNVLDLTVRRETTEQHVKIKPIYSIKDDTYKIGAWIKDSTQGIGTLTYIDPDTLSFGALGHGITDKDIKRLMPIKTGELTDAHISCIKKGEKGKPGEIGGTIDYSKKNKLGTITKNTPLGIYGYITPSKKDNKCHKPVPIAFKDEIYEGKASILVNLEGDKIEPYEIEIQKVAKFNQEPSKGMVLKITDKKLLELTGGIVQGMSGSPILQDGKLIGAVTHVFVQDPSKGYGIFIENMINNKKI